jgi:V-type H+-transporting ATPase subunit E
MTLEAIIAKIEKETSENVNEILEASKQESEKKLNKAQQELRNELEQEKKKAERNREVIRNIHLSNARRMARRTVLSEKEKLINSCFDHAKISLKELGELEYKKTVRRLITEGMKLIGKETIVIPSKDDDLSVISEFSNLTISNERTGAIGGIILKSKDGKIIVNNTFEAILERYKDDIRTKVASILFSD